MMEPHTSLLPTPAVPGVEKAGVACVFFLLFRCARTGLGQAQGALRALEKRQV